MHGVTHRGGVVLKERHHTHVTLHVQSEAKCTPERDSLMQSGEVKISTEKDSTVTRACRRERQATVEI